MGVSIDRDMLYAAIEEMEKIGTTDNENDSVVSTESVLELIDEQPDVSEWIPCRERMPDRDGQYLVYDRVSKAQFVTQYWGDGTWRTVRAEITHWRPLPDDPKGDEGNENE